MGGKVKILMFGWELPPHNSGGLGVACHHLAKALASEQAEVTFVLPRKIDVGRSDFKLRFASEGSSIPDPVVDGIKYKGIETLLFPYVKPIALAKILYQGEGSY